MMKPCFCSPEARLRFPREVEMKNALWLALFALVTVLTVATAGRYQADGDAVAVQTAQR